MSEGSILEQIARVAAKHPNAAAVIGTELTLTYTELLRVAGRVGSCLRAAQVEPEESVGVLMHREASLVATLLGIWGAGAAYVPIDSGEPPARIREILARTRCTKVIGDEMLWRAVLETPSPNLSAVTFIARAQITSESDGPAIDGIQAVAGVDPSHLAYRMCTSGTTGEPKAVEIEHRSVENLLRRAGALLSVTSRDRCLAVAPISFDISVVELFLPLTVGGTVVLRGRSLLMDPRELARVVREFDITFVQTGPPVWAVLLRQVSDFPRVRVAVSTGDALAPSVAKLLRACADEAWNLYGPTEATVWATAHRLTQADESTRVGATVPIGVPLPGCRVRVVDREGQEVPKGARGELLIGGDGLSRGYCGSPTQTAERFVERDGERWYRSGDWVSRNEAGVLGFFGRLDDQMKIRGIRVEPSEIERAIRVDPRVSDVATTWFETPSATRAIVAAIVLRTGANCSASDLRVRLEAALPSALIPSRFVFLPEVPIDANGKVNRQAIRTWARAQPHGELEAAASRASPDPQNTAAVITEIWCRLLGTRSIPPDAHFFGVGGDSLAGVTMILEVEEALGVRLPMQLVLELPVLRDFADRVEVVRGATLDVGERTAIFRLVEVPDTSPLFLCGAPLSIAGRWTAPCSLYVIADWAQGGEGLDTGSIEAMARTYVDQIRAMRPGPYRIGGFSFGGLFALEIAQQLVREGDEVEFLFLLDPIRLLNTSVAPNTGIVWDRQRRAGHFAARVGGYLTRVNPMRQGGGLIGWLNAVAKPFEKTAFGRRVFYRVFHVLAQDANPVAKAFVARRRWPEMWAANRAKLGAYVPRAYLGRSFGLFTEDQGGHEAWSSILNDAAHFRFVDVKHLDLFESPALEEWMSWLAEELTNS
jgi:amino acid adenylation domain-containing protein